jgi:hypothetical protein
MLVFMKCDLTSQALLENEEPPDKNENPEEDYCPFFLNASCSRRLRVGSPVAMEVLVSFSGIS